MPLLTSDLLAQNLRETNARLNFWLGSLRPQSTAVQKTVSPQQMAGILSELMRAGEWLRRLPAEKDPDLAREFSEYRRNVERVRELLPFIHAALLAEKARLELERARVASSMEWARRSRQTL